MCLCFLRCLSTSPGFQRTKLKPLGPAPPLPSIFDALRDFPGTVFQSRRCVVEPVAQRSTETARRAGDGVADATARGACDSAHRSGEAADCVLEVCVNGGGREWLDGDAGRWGLMGWGSNVHRRSM